MDTSAWVETIRERGDPAVRERVSNCIAEDKAVLCDIVRLELWNGARSKGLTIPAADLVIAACAEHYRLGLIYQDSLFEQLRQLRDGVS